MEIDDQAPRQISAQKTKYPEDLSKNTSRLNGECSS